MESDAPVKRAVRPNKRMSTWVMAAVSNERMKMRKYALFLKVSPLQTVKLLSWKEILDW